MTVPGQVSPTAARSHQHTATGLGRELPYTWPMGGFVFRSERVPEIREAVDTILIQTGEVAAFSVTVAPEGS